MILRFLCSKKFHSVIKKMEVFEAAISNTYGAHLTWGGGLFAGRKKLKLIKRNKNKIFL